MCNVCWAWTWSWRLIIQYACNNFTKISHSVIQNTTLRPILTLEESVYYNLYRRQWHESQTGDFCFALKGHPHFSRRMSRLLLFTNLCVWPLGLTVILSSAHTQSRAFSHSPTISPPPFSLSLSVSLSVLRLSHTYSQYLTTKCDYIIYQLIQWCCSTKNLSYSKKWEKNRPRITAQLNAVIRTLTQWQCRLAQAS